MIKIKPCLKGLILLLNPLFIMGWLHKPFLLISNTISLLRWVKHQSKSEAFNDFFTFRRDYSKRYNLYEHLVERHNLKDQPFVYLEFGVGKGHSIKWWLKNCLHPDQEFYGFDSFEGLPEQWGTFNQGDMATETPSFMDPRVKIMKGLFQDSLQDFLRAYKNVKRKVIHLDADLFSSTLFVLTSLAHVLNKNDIIIFDEFNVPNHEYYAYRVFTETYYIRTRLVAAVNNYLQAAFVVM